MPCISKKQIHIKTVLVQKICLYIYNYFVTCNVSCQWNHLVLQLYYYYLKLCILLKTQYEKYQIRKTSNVYLLFLLLLFYMQHKCNKLYYGLDSIHNSQKKIKNFIFTIFTCSLMNYYKMTKTLVIFPKLKWKKKTARIYLYISCETKMHTLPQNFV